MDIHNTDEFSMSFDYASGKTGERFQNPLWQITEIFFGRKLRDSVAKVKAFGRTIVGNAVTSRQSDGPAGVKISSDGKTFDAISGSLINSLLDSIDDNQMVADAALNYLSAGKPLYARLIGLSLKLCRKGHDGPSINLDLLPTIATSGASGIDPPRDHWGELSPEV
jgi:hypothetical protein